MIERMHYMDNPDNKLLYEYRDTPLRKCYEKIHDDISSRMSFHWLSFPYLDRSKSNAAYIELLTSIFEEWKHECLQGKCVIS